MTGPGYIRQIIIDYKYKLLVTNILFGLEMAADLLKPYFLGKAVNDLLRGGFQSLIIFLSLHIAWMLISMLRLRYDTRTYSTIYNAIILKFLADKTHGDNISKLSAHSTLTRELTDFLEFDLVYILEAVFNIFGSLLMLFFYDTKVVLLCVTVLIPIGLISRWYGKKMSVLMFHKNNEIENQVDVISSFDKKEIHKHYETLRRWQVKITDMQAYNFGVMEIVVVVLIGVALYISTRHAGVAMQEGELIGIYFYIMKFTKGLETIPYILEKYASLKDIVQRVSNF